MVEQTYCHLSVQSVPWLLILQDMSGLHQDMSYGQPETEHGKEVYPVILPKRDLDKRKALAAAEKEFRRVVNLHFDAECTEDCLERDKYVDCQPCEHCGLGIGEIMNCNWCEHECYLRVHKGKDAALTWRGIG